MSTPTWRHCHAEKISVYEWVSDEKPHEALTALAEIAAKHGLGFFKVTSTYEMNEDSGDYEWRVIAHLS